MEEASKAAEHFGLCHFTETSAAESFEAVDSVFRQLFRLTKASSQAIFAATVDQNISKTMSNSSRRRKSLTQLRDRLFDYHEKKIITKDVSGYRKKAKKFFKSKSYSHLKLQSNTPPIKCQSLCMLTEYPETTSHDTSKKHQRVQTMPRRSIDPSSVKGIIETKVVSNKDWISKIESKTSSSSASEASLMESSSDERSLMTEVTLTATSDTHHCTFLPKFPVLLKTLANENDIDQVDVTLNNKCLNEDSKMSFDKTELNSVMTLSGEERCEKHQRKNYFDSRNNFTDNSYRTMQFLKLLKTAVSNTKSKNSINKYINSRRSSDGTNNNINNFSKKKIKKFNSSSLLSSQILKENNKKPSIQDTVSEINCVIKNLSIL